MENEKRLIDANVVLAKQFTSGLSDASGNYYGHADIVLVNEIENAPTVDAVEVVRCKDCKHYDADSLICELIFNPCATNTAWYPEDFCSYGERKGNG